MLQYSLDEQAPLQTAVATAAEPAAEIAQAAAEPAAEPAAEIADSADSETAAIETVVTGAVAVTSWPGQCSPYSIEAEAVASCGPLCYG